MSRRHALLVSAAVLSPLLITACGESGSTPDLSTAVAPEVPVVLDTFELSADRLDGSTVLANDDDTVAVAVPDVALPAGLDPNDITATVNQLTATDVGLGVEFALGPDGTEFSEPVTLSWTGQWDPAGTVGVTAVADDGTNLLASREEVDEILKTLQVVPNGDGTSIISVEIDHFSRWSFVNFSTRGSAGSSVSTVGTGGSNSLTTYIDIRESGGRFSLEVSANSPQASVVDPELCVELDDVEVSNVTLFDSDARRLASNGLRRCRSGSRTSVSVEVDLQCTSTAKGRVSGLVITSYGLRFSPFDLFFALAASEKSSDVNPFATDDSFWGAASDALLYSRTPFDLQVDCTKTDATRITTTTTPGAVGEIPVATVPLGTVPTLPKPPALLPRPTPPGPGPTPPTPPTLPTTTAATTTTVKATTTTKPRQGATTTLPRPTTSAPRPVTGGTTTLP